MLDGAVWIWSKSIKSLSEGYYGACTLMATFYTCFTSLGPINWLPILHTLMLSCIVCCHAILPHYLLSPINALWTQQWHIVSLPLSFLKGAEENLA